MQGLDRDPANVEKTRQLVRKKGLEGRVFADQLTGERLPYVDNLVSLVVSDDLGKVSTAGVVRVLRPNGVAYLKTGQQWKRTAKPRPGAIDDWTRYLHDASNNPVSCDKVVGPPRHLQRKSPPVWDGVAAAGGRVYVSSIDRSVTCLGR